jgi:hypothetical protein
MNLPSQTQLTLPVVVSTRPHDGVCRVLLLPTIRSLER